MNAEHGPVSEQFVGQGLEPTQQRGFLSGLAHSRQRPFDQRRRALKIPGGQRVPDCLRR